ncbi:Arsenate reductase [Anaerohalosphaera lusitana]|uniref:Arsenate reductase n=1 Tax=Anaerohalosphaera lusitana TaxID=1936003 RepID=A0A1U9NHC0_9BACT|nr:arsenate reductase ArsC [Anaerohalosphaera lusitana]AQT67144.1 Arsenate reductase [Anaerohalosphaera lusitana]
MSQAKKKLNVLFLCTGNSCRSQMAEGWAKHLKGDVIEAFSAGVSPGKLNERAVEVMAEAGVDISYHVPQHVDDYAEIEMDYVVTVCDHAHETCPVFPGATKVVHRKFEDPSFKIGTIEEVMAEFRRVRDEIRDFVSEMPGNLEEMAK